MCRSLVLWFLVAALLPGSAGALELQTGRVEVSFHIEHPAKEYDAILLPDGGSARIQIDPSAIERTTASVSLKVDHFFSDNSRRDSHMIEVLEGLVFPTIEWTVTSVVGGSGPITPGVHRLTATGPLTIHGVTRPLSVPIELTVGGKGELTIGAGFSVALEEFGIERPTMVFVPIENIVPIIVKVDTGPNPAVLAPPPGPPAPSPEAPGPVAPEGR